MNDNNCFWLIYDQKRYEKNIDFVKYFSEIADKYKLNMITIFKDGDLDKILHGNAEKIGKKPAFAIVRLTNPKINYKLEKAGIPTFNDFFTSFITNDKFRCIKYIYNHLPEIKVVPSLKYSRIDTIRLLEMNKCEQSHFLKNKFCKKNNCICDKMLYNYVEYAEEFVIKSLYGHGGSEVFLLDSERDKVMEHLNMNDDKYYLIQPLIKPDNNVFKDVRNYVVGSEYIAGVMRQSENEFRANYSLGGSVAPYFPGYEEKKAIESIINIFNFGMAGIDFIFDEQGNFLFNEIEDVVGSRMLYKTYKDLDIVDKYLAYIVEKC